MNSNENGDKKSLVN